MAGSEQNPGSEKRRRSSDRVRLDSWKAIANHFSRSVRTVRRWEAEEGMPVHRHKHIKGASVYAYLSELDEWQQHHREKIAKAGLAASRNPAGTTTTSWGRLTVAVAVGAVIGGLVSQYVLPGAPRPAPEDVADQAAIVERVAPDPHAVVGPVIAAWADGRMHDALLEGELLQDRLPQLPPEAQRLVAGHLVDISLAMGRLDSARDIVATVTDLDLRTELVAQILLASGARESMRQQLDSGMGFFQDSTPLLMSMAGLTDKAIDLNSRLGPPAERAGHTELILAIAELQAGRPDFARPLLRAAITELAVSDQSYYFVALDMFARVQQLEGRIGEAVSTLERTSVGDRVAAANNAAFFWMMCQRQLANFYRESGRGADAVRIENDLRDRLVLADADFPLLQSLTGAT